VPSDMLGPYGFTVAPLHVLVDADGVPTTNPANATEGVDPASTITIPFNAPIDLATVIVDDNIVLTATADDTQTAIPLDPPAYSSEAVEDSTDVTVDPTAVVVSAPLEANTQYTVTVSAGITDIKGGLLNLDTPVTFSFTTGEAP
jgi:hypothetical protein